MKKAPLERTKKKIRKFALHAIISINKLYFCNRDRGANSMPARSSKFSCYGPAHTLYLAWNTNSLGLFTIEWFVKLAFSNGFEYFILMNHKDLPLRAQISQEHNPNKKWGKTVFQFQFASPSLKYCEDKNDHNSQVRINFELRNCHDKKRGPNATTNYFWRD